MQLAGLSLPTTRRSLLFACLFIRLLLIMAISEQSFRDRQGKSQLLRDTTAGFTPAFAPADSTLSATNFNTFLGGIGSANTNVETLVINYTNNATTRVALVKSIREATTQAVGYVKSNKAWANQFKAVKSAADKLRGVRPPTNTEPPPPVEPGTPPGAADKGRNKGQQAYVELAAHLEALVTALTACAGYSPTSATISASSFNALLSQFRGLNSFISTLDSQLTTARENRRRLYFEPGGLEEKFQAVKNAVKGQYGQSSAEYGAVKSIKW